MLLGPYQEGLPKKEDKPDIQLFIGNIWKIYGTIQEETYKDPRLSRQNLLNKIPERRKIIQSSMEQHSSRRIFWSWQAYPF